MILVTGIEGKGIRIGTVSDTSYKFDDLDFFQIQSENYLQQIESVVADAGSWSVISSWHVSLEGESFTSLRGLVTLVNALSYLHSLQVFSLNVATGEVEDAVLPIVPSYSCEPNITTKS